VKLELIASEAGLAPSEGQKEERVQNGEE